MRWTIEPTHSSLEFRVRHLGISTVRGKFKVFEGHVDLSDDGSVENVEAVIDAASIDTGADQRDGHLKSADFFDVENHPTMTFRSSDVEKTGEHEYRVNGELTLRGVNRPVSFTVESTPIVKDPWGNDRTGVTASGKLNRKDWGLTWNQALETGGVLVSDEVKFTLDLSLVPAASEATV